MAVVDIHLLMQTPLAIEKVTSHRGESWSLRGDRFKQRSDLLPNHLKRAFSCAGSHLFAEFLTERIENRPWAIELSCDGVSFSRDLFYELSIEHGYSVLMEALHPVSEKQG